MNRAIGISSRNLAMKNAILSPGFRFARASQPEQHAFIGNQAGGRVFLFLNTDDLWRDYTRMKSIVQFYSTASGTRLWNSSCVRGLIWKFMGSSLAKDK